MSPFRESAVRLGLLSLLAVVYGVVFSNRQTVNLYLAYSQLEDQVGRPLYGSAWMPLAVACLKTTVLIALLAPLAHWLGWLGRDRPKRDPAGPCWHPQRKLLLSFASLDSSTHSGSPRRTPCRRMFSQLMSKLSSSGPGQLHW